MKTAVERLDTKSSASASDFAVRSRDNSSCVANTDDESPSVCRWFDYLTEQDLSVRRVFEAVDTDDSGYLDRDEMRVAITRLCQQEGHAQLPEEEIQKAMALMDRDGGGQTDFDE